MLRLPNPRDPQTLPPAFWRWFDGSVGTMPRSKMPRVVFHGTRSPVEFDQFIAGTIRDDDGEVIVSDARDPSTYLGPHFTESDAVASRFAMGHAAAWDRSRYVHDAGGAGGRVIPVYLAIRKPKVFKSDQSMWDWIVKHGDSYQVDTVIEDSGEDDYGPAARMEAIEWLRSSGDDSSMDAGDSTPYESALEELGTSARGLLLSMGFDGVKYRNDVEGGGWSWVPLGSGQIKSAVANSGRYDSSSDSIID